MKKINILGAVLVLLSLLGISGARAAPFAYIPSTASNIVSVVDTQTNTVVATIPVGGPGGYPYGIAVNPSGTRAYVTLNLEGSVAVIDTATNSVLTTVPVGFSPIALAVNPEGNRVYVTKNDATISVIDADANSVIATIAVGAFPGAIVFKDGRVYVANRFSGTVSAIDPATNLVVATISVTGPPSDIVAHPSAPRVYVVDEIGNTVVEINTLTHAVENTFALLGSNPNGISISPDGGLLYVSFFSSGVVQVLDSSTGASITLVGAGTNPRGIAADPSGAFVYVANFGSNSVSVIATATNTVVATVPVGIGPVSIGHFIGPLPAILSATLTVSGPFTVGSSATYTVILSNTGGATQLDNPGNEFTSVLPSGLTLVGVNATRGTAVANLATNTVTWNGVMARDTSATLTITATINAAPVGTVISSQGSILFDGDTNGTNESTALTDEPGLGGVADPTSFVIAATAGPAASIPTLSQWSMILMSGVLVLVGFTTLRRKRF